VGHSGWLEMGLLLHHGMWIRALGSLHGVSLLLPIAHSLQDMEIQNADENCSWAHEICNEDNEERAIVVASMNEMAYVLQAWLPLIVWKQVDAPNYQKGYITIVFLAGLLIVTAFTIQYLWARELLR